MVAVRRPTALRYPGFTPAQTQRNHAHTLDTSLDPEPRLVGEIRFSMDVQLTPQQSEHVRSMRLNARATMMTSVGVLAMAAFRSVVAYQKGVLNANKLPLLGFVLISGALYCHSRAAQKLTHQVERMYLHQHIYNRVQNVMEHIVRLPEAENDAPPPAAE